MIINRGGGGGGGGLIDIIIYHYVEVYTSNNLVIKLLQCVRTSLLSQIDHSF